MTSRDEALRALEKKLRKKAENARREAGWSRESASFFDERDMLSRAETYTANADEIAAILSDRQEVAPVESVWMFRCAGSSDEWMPFVSEKHRLNTMRSPEWEVREFTSPAQTSEARDAVWLDWLERNGSVGISEGYHNGGKRFFELRDSDDNKLSEGPSLRAAIDAAMRQEAE